MSASNSQELARLDALQAEHEALLRKNGRLSFAQEVLDWAVKHRAELPPHLRAELGEMVLKAGE